MTAKQIAGYLKARREKRGSTFGGITFNDGYNVPTFGITKAEYDAINRAMTAEYGAFGEPTNLTPAVVKKALRSHPISAQSGRHATKKVSARRPKKIKISTSRPIGWTITDPARPGWAETGTTTSDELKEAFQPKRHHATKKSPAQLQREINEVLAKPKTHYRSAVSGRYVQKDSARRRPRTTIKESHAKKRGAHATRKLDDFTKAYLEAALWSSTDDEGTPLDKNYDIENFAPEAIAAAVKDATTFQSKNRIDLVKASKMAKKREHSSDAQHGHDFWLTRNGLGVGFWDRGYGDVGERLSDAARTYGSVDLYVGDDGALHFS